MASVALFSELYNNDKYTNVTDILGEFIKGAVISEGKWTINSTELKLLLESTYDFKIPESVIRTTVKNRLKDLVTLRDGHYVFSSAIKDGFEGIENAYNVIKEKQNNIFSQLVEFIELREERSLSEADKKQTMTFEVSM